MTVLLTDRIVYGKSAAFFVASASERADVFVCSSWVTRDGTRVGEIVRSNWSSVDHEVARDIERAYEARDSWARRVDDDFAVTELEYAIELRDYPKIHRARETAQGADLDRVQSVFLEAAKRPLRRSRYGDEEDRDRANGAHPRAEGETDESLRKRLSWAIVC